MIRTNSDLILISKIVLRAEEMDILQGERLVGMLDMSNAHEEFNLALQEFLDADEFNFAHDFIGIQNHIDRSTGKMSNYFLPRFARGGEDVVEN